ncbi:tryptophan 7-halogenase [Thalassotalea sp. 1_MG-2023]|uniref:NAD(P)/FAD-dependent oxidoreductase n=1 Tax=Thalassotalea sp. 1_MG-2023 TaxID=3062680 RepID=UPI0026E463F6|nr:tryptophan 7-halogenase [Thalassotalea sp. 1_MG-2023]MDO6426643.1 tryptophan 7-halogenase [Thalassotalea sp. 1_MG-2023]
MKIEHVDVIIIGAGPAGAVAGAMLANLHHKVLIIEKEHFPRFSIGESLLPQCMAFIKQAGLLESLEKSANSLSFQFKNGAAFCHQGKYTDFDFTQKFTEGPGTTYQVKRAGFDKLLADGAKQKGVDIRYGQIVKKIDVEGESPVVDIETDDGELYQATGKFLLDASGFGRVLPRLLQLETPSSFPVRQSCFAHVKDNITDVNFDRNKILITVHPEFRDIWYWLIPFADGTASIGVVGEPSMFDQQLTANQLLESFIEQAPNLKHLLNEASFINSARVIKGYAANVDRLYGHNYALLGNAGEFLDPVFSSGVTIAMKSASLITPIVDKKIKGEPVDIENDFAIPLKQGIDCFKTFVSAWYDGRFQDVIFFEQQESQIKEMISSILAGYAWDDKNPYVAQSERRLNVLVKLCNDI